MTAAALLVVVGSATAGCGEGGSAADDTFEPTRSASPSTSATPVAPPSSSAAEAATFDDKGHDVLPGRVRAGSTDQRAVADAWLDYWRVRLASYHDASVDPSALGRVATGAAAGEVTSYVATLKQRRHHTVGDMRINVAKVRVRRDTATLQSCVENRTTDRDRSGKPVERLTPFYVFGGNLTRESGTWRVASLTIERQAPCA